VSGKPNIVLVHGAWADGSCWSGVIERLQADGFHVQAPQFPLNSLAADVSRLRQVLEFQDGRRSLRGIVRGQIITAPDRTPNVVGLVYIALADEATAGRAPLARARRWRWHICSPTRAARLVVRSDFVDHFAGDVDPIRARVVRRPAADRLVGLHRRDGAAGAEIAAVGI
jgi:hypothetical protein